MYTGHITQVLEKDADRCGEASADHTCVWNFGRPCIAPCAPEHMETKLPQSKRFSNVLTTRADLDDPDPVG